ncbi:hypothetical protein MTP99_001356 [Tenebrio molitor]|nr:hypothetical protein MTP99_001356 [Tenebrio molitor]
MFKKLQKNLELKEKLKAYQENNNKVSTYVELNQAKYDKKIEELNTENAELQNNYLDLKRKFNAVKARCKVLETEYGVLKAKLSNSKQTSSRSGYSTSRGNTPKQIEYDIKDKLELAEENVKALTTRLEIETFERKHDLQEFTKILKNYE